MAYFLSRLEWADYSNYEEDRCHNGGSYAFYQDWVEIRPGLYQVEYGCSSDFPYCSRRGFHASCEDCCDFRDGRCREQFEVFSVKDLQRRKEGMINSGWTLCKEDQHWRKWKGWKGSNKIFSSMKELQQIQQKRTRIGKVDSISLIAMREIMDWVPQEDDDPIFFTMKRVQQCVWLLKHSSIGVSHNMLKIFKYIVTNKKAKSNKAIVEAVHSGKYNWAWANPEMIGEMDKALNEGLRLMRAESNVKRVGFDNPQRIHIMWDTLWEFCNQGNPDWDYLTDIIISNPREYEEWLDRVIVLVEEAFK